MYMIYLASFEVLGRVNALLLKPGWLHTQYSSRFNNCGYEIFTAVTNPISSEEEQENEKVLLGVTRIRMEYTQRNHIREKMSFNIE